MNRTRGTWRTLTAGLIVALALAAGTGVLAQIAFYNKIALGSTACMFSAGAGTPEAAVVGSPCDLFLRTNGAAGTTLYVKETGVATNTGWFPASTAGGTIGVASGGTGIITYAIGDMLYASAATTFLKLADVSVGSYLRSGGVTTAPLWSTLKIPNAAAQGQVPITTAADTITMLAVGTAGQFLRGAGAAANPTWSTNVFPNTVAQGEVMAATAANTYTNLAVGTAGQLLRSAGAAANVTWSTNVWPNTIAQGELPTATAANTITALAVGTAGQILKSGGAAANVSWATRSDQIHLPAATCDHNAGITLWSAGLGAGYPTETCDVAGTVLYGDLSFSDGATERAVSHVTLPADWTSTVDLVIKWYSAATAGNVVWQVATQCTADGENFLTGAWNAAQDIVDATQGTTLRMNTAAQVGVTMTGCAAGEELWIELMRTPTHVSDTLGAAADFLGMTVTIRRTM